jgi:RNA polymerase sigma-70 factor (ECF subfamily)
VQQIVAGRGLLADAREGSERAFESLLAPLIDPGYRLACGMLHDGNAANDAVQEAALKAWRKLGQLQTAEKARSWFLGIVANECRNARRLKWKTGVTLGLPPLHERSHEERVLGGTDIERAIAKLKHEDRAVVILFFYLDLPLEEVASVTGTSVAAARARLYRAIRKLRPDLEIEEALK